jgi:hypothetical protein
MCLSHLNLKANGVCPHVLRMDHLVALSDGGVHVFEPLESEGKWGVPPPVEDGSPSCISIASPMDQPQS